ncbi:hypothetical protein BDV36DRAFT_263341 [Aspergillus pseudocaelatus]|uniref:Uncharacterized protein n=1 Tax=Aspergillus pseudocaelatus TaxID=1825620 RepID=A0ABQ6WDL9_9EURO|nr:hypothetical protein BDV36DRAFT_263341 [Aspergillus pseudocaelatus]
MGSKANCPSLCTYMAARTIGEAVSIQQSSKSEKLTMIASMHNTASMVGWSEQPFIGVSFNYR